MRELSPDRSSLAKFGVKTTAFMRPETTSATSYAWYPMKFLKLPCTAAKHQNTKQDWLPAPACSTAEGGHEVQYIAVKNLISAGFPNWNKLEATGRSTRSCF